jgi:hypothetical protein
MAKQIKRKLLNQAGAAIVEYTPILTLFLLVTIPSVQLAGLSLSNRFCELKTGILNNKSTEALPPDSGTSSLSYSVYALCVTMASEEFSPPGKSGFA